MGFPIAPISHRPNNTRRLETAATLGMWGGGGNYGKLGASRHIGDRHAEEPDRRSARPPRPAPFPTISRFALRPLLSSPVSKNLLGSFWTLAIGHAGREWMERHGRPGPMKWGLSRGPRTGGPYFLQMVLTKPLAQKLERLSYKPYGDGPNPSGRILALRAPPKCMAAHRRPPAISSPSPPGGSPGVRGAGVAFLNSPNGGGGRDTGRAKRKLQKGEF